MFSMIFVGLALSLPGDTIGCGLLDASYMLEHQIAPIVTHDSDGYRAIRSELGLVQQATDVPRAVLTLPSECEVFVQYFTQNIAGLADEALLAEMGWHHAVLSIGPYKVLVVAVKHPGTRILSHRTYILFFDADNTFLSSAQI